MFTRYNNLNIPQNYSGSRFAQAKNSYETEMKTHPKVATSPTKTSVSPTFNEYRNSKRETYIESEENEEISASPYEMNLESETEKEVIGPEENEKTPQASTACESDNRDADIIAQLKGGVNSILKNLSKDDLLLIGLILLTMGNGSEISITTILSLLLLYH